MNYLAFLMDLAILYVAWKSKNWWLLIGWIFTGGYHC